MEFFLPKGFKSWSEVLTDSVVSRALSGAKLPSCLQDKPELAAPLVREISARLGELLFHRRVSVARLLEAKLTEPAFDRAGGEDYHQVCVALAAAQQSYFERYRESADTPERQVKHTEMKHAQQAFDRLRRLHADTVQTAVTAGLREHWTAQKMACMPDTIFADAEFSFAGSRLARIHPAWWGRFFGRTQVLSKQGHPAHGEFLDALPKLMTDTGRCTIEGAIYEWRKSRNDHWGWYREENHRMLAKRAMDKARTLTRWYAKVAPDYLTNGKARVNLHSRLAERLAAMDPWQVPDMPAANWLAGMQGRN